MRSLCVVETFIMSKWSHFTPDLTASQSHQQLLITFIHVIIQSNLIHKAAVLCFNFHYEVNKGSSLHYVTIMVAFLPTHSHIFSVKQTLNFE